jgi:tetratricopeptide (TPR) repeat protein
MNFKTLFFVLFISISANSILAQSDGYWDKERAFIKEIVVSARERIVVKTDVLPVGTTEVVFRITLLDSNQQLASSLISLLKSIPDPTGISQGTAGAVFLMSKISGDDKCKYAVFSNEALATEYQKSGKKDKACFEQNLPVSKDVKTLSIDESLCILPKSNAMWFGFESKNWIMNQKIVIEVMPWVNIRLNRGWTLDNKKTILSQCKTTELAKTIIDSDDFCVCILDKVQKEYRFQDFQKLLPIEKVKAYKDIGNACLKEMAASNTVYEDLRVEVSKLAKQGNYGGVIDKISYIILYGMGTDMDFNTLGNAYIMTKQYGKAIKYLKEGEKLNDYELLIKMNLAHAYLLNDDYRAARSIYKEYKSQNVSATMGWTQKVKSDFETFEKAGLPSQDFNRVLRLIE